MLVSFAVSPLVVATAVPGMNVSAALGDTVADGFSAARLGSTFPLFTGTATQRELRRFVAALHDASRLIGSSDAQGRMVKCVSQKLRRRPPLMDHAVLAQERSDPDNGAFGRHDDQGSGPLSWLARYNTVLTVIAACLTPVAYLVYLDRYAVNTFYLDDWFNVPVVHGALHGHLSMGLLWAQYNNSRIMLGRLVYILFAFADHLDLRAVVLFDGVMFIAAYGILLAVYRRYIGRSLTPIPVVVIGLMWFSLVDVGNSLWSFQVSWYLVPVFLVVMLYALLVPHNRINLWFVIAVAAAVGASLSYIQGFILWPLAVIGVFWLEGWTRRSRRKVAVVAVVAAVTAAIYVHGFSFGLSNCESFGIYGRYCSSNLALHHPLETLQYMVVLMGNVLPGGTGGLLGLPQNFTHELIGIVLLVVALFIVVQSWRHRATRDSVPLPLMLILFALVNDVFIAIGRYLLWDIARTSAMSSRYSMPNLVLLTGIAIYALKRVPGAPKTSSGDTRRQTLAWAVPLVLVCVLGVQVVGATRYGIIQGAQNRSFFLSQARVAANISRFPASTRPCELSFLLDGIWSPTQAVRVMDPKISDVTKDHLGQFALVPYGLYQDEPAPPLSGECVSG